MGLLEEIRESTLTPGSICSVARLLASPALAPPDRKDLAAAIADLSLTSAAIARAMNKRADKTGVRFRNGDPITRHRRGDCRCSDNH
jgi:hypothetical protein